MGAEASIDKTVLHRLGIKHRYLPTGSLERKRLSRWMVRALFAEIRIFNAAHRRREPHPALAVEHAVVIVGALAPDFPLAPVGRSADRIDGGIGVQRRSKRFRRIRVGD